MEDDLIKAAIARVLGGPGSGNFGHGGRPGEVGGSSSEGGGEKESRVGPEGKGWKDGSGGRQGGSEREWSKGFKKDFEKELEKGLGKKFDREYKPGSETPTWKDAITGERHPALTPGHEERDRGRIYKQGESVRFRHPEGKLVRGVIAQNQPNHHVTVSFGGGKLTNIHESKVIKGK